MPNYVILQVLPALNQGGVERGTLEIATALTQAGIENYVASNGGKMVPLLDEIGVKHITMPLHTKNPFKMWLNARRLAHLIAQKGINLVHVRSRAPAFSVKWACKKCGIPFITTFHGSYTIKPKWLKKPYNRIMVSGVKVIAISQWIKQHIMQEYGVKDDKIRLIFRGADAQLFNPSLINATQKEAFLKTHGIDTTKPIITIVGRLSPRKGHIYVIDAIKQMHHQSFTLLCIGGNAQGDYQQELSAKLGELPASVDVKIISVPSTDMPIAYSVSDICVQPTVKPEAFGRTIVEAQMMKTIIISFAHGGALETIKNGKTGFLTPVCDSVALAKTMDKALDLSSDEKSAIMQQAYESAVQFFSVSAMQINTLNVYKEILCK